jgi:hypothetical protein
MQCSYVLSQQIRSRIASSGNGRICDEFDDLQPLSSGLLDGTGRHGPGHVTVVDHDSSNYRTAHRGTGHGNFLDAGDVGESVSLQRIASPIGVPLLRDTAPVHTAEVDVNSAYTLAYAARCRSSSTTAGPATVM